MSDKSKDKYMNKGLLPESLTEALADKEYVLLVKPVVLSGKAYNSMEKNHLTNDWEVKDNSLMLAPRGLSGLSPDERESVANAVAHASGNLIIEKRIRELLDVGMDFSAPVALANGELYDTIDYDGGDWMYDSYYDDDVFVPNPEYKDRPLANYLLDSEHVDGVTMKRAEDLTLEDKRGLLEAIIRQKTLDRKVAARLDKIKSFYPQYVQEGKLSEEEHLRSCISVDGRDIHPKCAPGYTVFSIDFRPVVERVREPQIPSTAEMEIDGMCFGDDNAKDLLLTTADLSIENLTDEEWDQITELLKKGIQKEYGLTGNKEAYTKEYLWYDSKGPTPNGNIEPRHENSIGQREKNQGAKEYIISDRAFDDGVLTGTPKEMLRQAISLRDGRIDLMDVYKRDDVVNSPLNKVLAEGNGYALIDNGDSVNLWKDMSKQEIRDSLYIKGYSVALSANYSNAVQDIAAELRLEDPTHQIPEHKYYALVGFPAEGKLGNPDDLHYDNFLLSYHAIAALLKAPELRPEFIYNNPLFDMSHLPENDTTLVAEDENIALTYSGNIGYALYYKIPDRQAEAVLRKQGFDVEQSKTYTDAMQQLAERMRNNSTGTLLSSKIDIPEQGRWHQGESRIADGEKVSKESVPMQEETSQKETETQAENTSLSDQNEVSKENEEESQERERPRGIRL